MAEIYLDHCATTPVDARVLEAMDQARERLRGNPSSIHAPGRRARAVLTEARSHIAQTLGVMPAELIFTGSGSEANNLALKGIVFSRWPRPVHLAISSIEHDSARNTARYLAERFEHVTLTEIDPDSAGVVHPADVARACGDAEISLISMMAVNNETGVVQPVEALAEFARARGALFHCDAVQALGRLEVSPPAWGCDFLTVSAHKIYGPRGIGLLYARRGIRFDPLVHGGHQEGGRRAGTENGAAIVGFRCALERAAEARGEINDHLGRLEAAFLETLRESGIAFELNGGGTERVAGVINLAIRGIQSHDLVVGMDLQGFAISAGAACSSGVIEPSHVLRAMGLEAWRVEGGVRISFGKSNTPEEAVGAANALSALAKRLLAGSASAISSESVSS